MRSACDPRANVEEEGEQDRVALALRAASQRLASPKPQQPSSPTTVDGSRRNPVILYSDHVYSNADNTNDLLATGSPLRNSSGSSPDRLLYLLHMGSSSEDFSAALASGETVSMAVWSATLLYNFAVAHIIKASVESDVHHQQRWNAGSMQLLELAYEMLKSRAYEDVCEVENNDFMHFAAVLKWIVNTILWLSSRIPVPTENLYKYQADASLLQRLFDGIWHHLPTCGTSTAGAA